MFPRRADINVTRSGETRIRAAILQPTPDTERLRRYRLQALAT